MKNIIQAIRCAAEFAAIAAFVGSVICLSACGTYNTWTPETSNTVDAYYERSCASGYYECGNGSRGGRGGGGHGDQK
ncbi:hypothetical protein M8997_003860 [Phyllobacterium sp. 21LDTY02-6]|uniref:hypothetical protein n=1 Tax=Phyllobacterium sp. 21LDTY02-6 TaxID=2944903 RepID=UPI0020204535|nr:hypothetical protein [Phyllobacterium sp. 21LDTY02-6]MCO4316308.1 hypothetical protein [Phyllobacterium sp. 21LDTY02-6]